MVEDFVELKTEKDSLAERVKFELMGWTQPSLFNRPLHVA